MKKSFRLCLFLKITCRDFFSNLSTFEGKMLFVGNLRVFGEGNLNRHYSWM